MSSLIDKNNLIYNLYKLITLLNRKNKFRIIYLLIILFLSTIAEMISLSLIIPFLAAFNDPQLIWDSQIAREFLTFLGFNSSDNLLLPITIIFILSVLFASILKLFNNWYRCLLIAKISCDISFKAFSKSIYQPYYIHLRRNSSELIGAVTSHIGGATNALGQLLYLVNYSFLSLGIFCTLILIQFRFSLIISFVFISIYLVLLIITQPILRKNSQNTRKFSEKRVQIIQESFGAFRDVIIDNNEDFFIRNYVNFDYPIRKMERENEFLSIYPKFIIEGVSLVSVGLIALIAEMGNYSLVNILPLLGFFGLAAQKFLPALHYIYSSFTSIKANTFQLKSTLGLISQAENKNILISDKEIINFHKNISFNSVHFSYDNEENLIIKNSSFEINKGDKVGIVGKTGSGKSTLIDLLIGLIKPTSGEIFIDDNNLNKSNQKVTNKSWISQIGHVPQSIYLVDDTIAKNIAFGIPEEKINYKRIKELIKIVLLDDFIKNTKMGLKTVVGERGIILSGGQRQRIGIARALYKENIKILILDEATSALDNYTESKLIENINSMTKNYTLIMIAHRLTTLKKCNKIFEIKKGIIKETSLDKV